MVGRKKRNILIIFVSVIIAISIVTPLVVILPRKRCVNACASDVLQCGATCTENAHCVGSVCDDPRAKCEDGMCIVRHACTSTGECVPDPNGPFDGPTCKCYGARPPCDPLDITCVNGDGPPDSVLASVASNTCNVVANGMYASVEECASRNADFACVPGEGRCQRTIGASTGWRSEEECACFECPADTLTCVPSLETHPSNGIDGDGCLRCGRWACDGAGACVQSGHNGVWDDPADCSCGMCSNGSCVPAVPSGGAYTSVSACEADEGNVCRDPTLGWACDMNAGNLQMCRQTLGGTASSVDTCHCWSCDGEWPGPESQCKFDATHPVDGFNTRQACFDDTSKKCGWMYQCNSN